MESNGVPEALLAIYRDAVRDSARSWSDATEGRIGTIEFVEGTASAQIVVRFVSGPGVTAFAATTATMSGRLLTHAAAEIRRPARDVELLQRGRGGDVAQVIQQVVGHEMGHALGIMMHSPSSRDLMAGEIRVGRDGNAITAADRHTLLQAYCE
jgi:predicted Zn-dependent protease